jgi:hypothetical protein
MQPASIHSSLLPERGSIPMMMALKVVVDFICCHCGQSLNVTLHCEGKGLSSDDAVVAVLVPCPDCQEVNQVYFEPHGGVRRVCPHSRFHMRFLPSLN